MTDYTPTTEEVKGRYADNRVGIGEWTRYDESVKREVEAADAEFDRWLEAHDREVAAKALEEFVAKVTDELAATRDEGIDLGEHYLNGMRSALRQASRYATHLREKGGA